METSADFDSFFDQHIGRTQRLLEVMLGDASLAEEAAQEAFARAFRQWESVAEMTSPDGWVLTVGLELCTRLNCGDKIGGAGARTNLTLAPSNSVDP